MVLLAEAEYCRCFDLGEGNVLVLLWLLFILRMLNRTSGSRHKIGDNVFLIFIAYWLRKRWILAFIQYLQARVYIIKSQIKQGGYYRSLYLGGLALLLLHSNGRHFYESAQSFDDLCLSDGALFYFVFT